MNIDNLNHAKALIKDVLGHEDLSKTEEKDLKQLFLIAIDKFLADDISLDDLAYIGGQVFYNLKDQKSLLAGAAYSATEVPFYERKLLTNGDEFYPQLSEFLKKIREYYLNNKD